MGLFLREDDLGRHRELQHVRLSWEGRGKEDGKAKLLSGQSSGMTAERKSQNMMWNTMTELACVEAGLGYGRGSFDMQED